MASCAGHTGRLACCQQGLQSCVVAVAIACFKVEVGRSPSCIRACLLYCLYFSRRGTLQHSVRVQHDQRLGCPAGFQGAWLGSGVRPWNAFAPCMNQSRAGLCLTLVSYLRPLEGAGQLTAISRDKNTPKVWVRTDKTCIGAVQRGAYARSCM